MKLLVRSRRGGPLPRGWGVGKGAGCIGRCTELGITKLVTKVMAPGLFQVMTIPFQDTEIATSLLAVS